MPDLTSEIKTEILRILINDGPLSALVSPSRIYGQVTPTKPGVTFIRYEGQEAEPYHDSCGSGTEAGVRLHIMTDSEEKGGRIASAVVEALDGASGFLYIDWQRTQTIPGAEADETHIAVDFLVAMTQ